MARNWKTASALDGSASADLRLLSQTDRNSTLSTLAMNVEYPSRFLVIGMLIPEILKKTSLNPTRGIKVLLW